MDQPAPPHPGSDPHQEMKPLATGPVRVLLLAAGWLLVALAVLGIFLPVLPTTPFLLVAAACFARSSERFYVWLLENRLFGPLIRDWREHGTIPRRAKWTAIAMIVVFLGSSIVLFVTNPWVRGVLLAIGVGLVVFLWRMPIREDEAPRDATGSGGS